MTEAQLYQQVLQQIEAGIEPTAFSDYIRYLLVETTLNSLAENQIPALVSRAVELGVWSAEYALDVASRIPDAQKCTRIYTRILAANRLNDLQRDNVESLAVNALNAIDYEGSRILVAGELIPQLSKPRQTDVLTNILNQAVKLAVEDQWDQGQSFSRLAPLLPADLLKKATEELNKINNAKAKAWVGAALSRHLEGDSKQKLLEHSIETALTIEDKLHRANVLAQLADQVTGDLVERVLQATLAINNEQWRPRILDRLAGQLNEEQKRAALHAALAIEHPWYRAFALRGLIPYLKNDLLSTALEAALTVQSDEAHALIISGVVFPPEWHERVLDIIQKMETESYRAQALVGFASTLEESQKEELLEQILTLIHESPTLIQSPYTMINLIPQLEEPAKGDLVAKTLDTILAISDEETSRYPFAELMKYLPDTLLPQALEGALNYEDEISRSYVFDALAKRLPVELLKQALNRTSTNDYEARARVLMGLSPFLVADSKSKALWYALQAIKAIKNLWLRSELLTHLLGKLHGEQKEDVTAYTLNTVLALPNYNTKVTLLAALLDYVSNEQRGQIFDAAFDLTTTIADAESRSRALVALAKHTEGVQKEKLLSLAFECAMQVSTEKPDYMPIEYNPRSGIVASVGAEASGTILTQVLETLLNEKTQFWEILMVLDRPFTVEQLALAQKLVKTIESKVCYGEALAVLAQHLDGQAKIDALNEAWEIAKSEKHLFRRLELLKALTKQVKNERLTEVIALAIDLTLQMEEENRVIHLLPFLPFVSDNPRLLLEIQKLMLQDFQKQQHQTREAVLASCNLLQPPILPASALVKVMDSIIEICWQNS